jgi:predicted nuclease of predicted toxin-antitoxin system
MLRLMLDENISPALSTPLWERGIDTATARDRGLLEAGDHTIWNIAQSENRSVVTINAGDFKKLAHRTERHAGLVLLPSGRTRDGQLKLIVSVIETVQTENLILPSMRGRIFEVGEDEEIYISEQAEFDASATGRILKLVKS